MVKASPEGEGSRVRSRKGHAVRDGTSAERDLFTRFRGGDIDAFREVYETYHRNVQGFAIRRGRNPSDAEDITQETFLQAFRCRHAFEGRSTILTWLLGIARFVCLRWERFAHRWVVGSNSVQWDVDPAFDPRTEARIDAARDLEQCVETLRQRRTEADRQIFRLRYFEQMPIQSIADQVEKSQDAVKTSLCRSRRMLRFDLERQEQAA